MRRPVLTQSGHPGSHGCSEGTLDFLHTGPHQKDRPHGTPCGPTTGLHPAGSLHLPSPSSGGANDAEDCCLSVTQRPIPGNIVRAFRYLLLKDGCRVPAVVFTTLRGFQLCAPPDQPWVERIIRRLKKSSAKIRRHSS